MSTSLILVGSTLLAGVGCKSKQDQISPELGRYEVKKIKAPPTPDSPLTSLGENSSPSYSPDGKKILFVSKNRPAHRNQQIYEMDLETYEEKRMTFSDGEEGSPIYNSGGTGFFYSSTTDELKERPLLLRKKGEDDVFPPTEIYFRSLVVMDIERLTERPGFDGIIKPGLAKNELFFTTLAGDKKQVFRLNVVNKKSSPLFFDRKEDRREFTAVPGLWAWIVTDPSHPSIQRLKVAKKTLTRSRIFDFGDAIYKDLKWLIRPEETTLVMTAVFKDSPQSAIVVLRPEQNCIAPILANAKIPYADGDFAADMETMVYTSQGQIYRKKIDWTKVICSRTSLVPPAPQAAPVAKPTATQTPVSQ